MGLLTNAFSGVLEKSWTAATEVTIDSAIASATADLERVSATVTDVDDESLGRFLGAPETAACLRMLFIARVHGSEPTTDQLREIFVGRFERTFPNADSGHADGLFEAMAAATEQLLAVGAASGDAEAQQAVAAAHVRRIGEELAGLRASLETLLATPAAALEEYLEWERLYRGQVLVRHGTITPPSFDASERVPVGDIYIEAKFRIPGGAGREERQVSGAELAATMNRTVALGDPGAGKSTFALKLAYDLARERATVAGGAPTPLIVTLKDYGAEKQRSHPSLLQWIESVVNADYNVAPPEGAVEYLLASGRAVVILDGLDELLDTSYRREITRDIETFAARFVASPMLVTSRRIGYAQAPLDPRCFDIAHLSELGEEQVAKYAELWFGLRRELNPKEQRQMSADFLRDSAEATDDLRRNTLMLALLCNIYRGDGYIPRQRPQVYEKCAVMLFERWDRGRRIVAPLEFERHLRPAMQHLAYWIYSGADLRGGVTEAALVKSATDFLLERRFDDEDAARQEAQRFVEFCRGRAWVFTDTGTTASGERLYQFTHRTFLEFFAAEHLVRTHRTPQDLGAVLLPRIQEGEWDVVAQLAFQLQDDNIDGAGDDLLGDVLQEARGANSDVTLSFAARSLAFLVPRRRTCRAVARTVTRRTLQWLMTEGGDVLPEATSPADTHQALACVDRENFEPVSEALVEEAVAYFEGRESVQSAEAIMEVAANTDVAMWGQAQAGQSHRWNPVRIEAFEALWPRLEEYLGASQALAYDAFVFGTATISEVVRLHSTRSLFEVRHFRLYGSYIRRGLVDTCLGGQLGNETRLGGEPIGTRSEFEELGEILADTPPPWDTLQMVHSGLQRHFQRGGLVPLDPDLEGGALFGAFAALAVTAEHAQIAGDLDAFLEGMSKAGGWIERIAPLVRRRFRAGEGSEPLPELPLDGPAVDAVTRWSDGTWSAVEPSVHEPRGAHASS